MPSSSKYSLGRTGGGQGKKTIELQLPSFRLDDQGRETDEHNVCVVRAADPTLLLSAGLLDDFDELTGLVAAKIGEVDSQSHGSAQVIRELSGQMDKLKKGMELVDRLCELVVVEPAVVWPVLRHPQGHPLAGQPIKDKATGLHVMLGPDERDDDTLYTDDVDLEDRMFILQYSVGGVKDPAQFRREYEASMATVANGAGLPLSALGSPPNS